MQKKMITMIVLAVVVVALVLFFTPENSDKGSDSGKTDGGSDLSAAAQAEEPVYSNTVETVVEPVDGDSAEGDTAEEEPTE